jgi:hypothetical protein
MGGEAVNKPMIPSMGGREMGPVYNRFIEAMPDGLDVVEVGAWLGAGTYELASAMREHGHKSTLHVFDRFIADKSEVHKAAGVHKYRTGVAVDGLGSPIKLKAGQDTLPVVRGFLKAFPFVTFYKGNINALSYTGKSIGVLVVDAAKRGKDFRRLMGKIEPHLAPGAIVFFMDFYFHLFKKDAGTSCQAEYVKASGKYEHLESYKNLCVEVMRYEG